MRQRTISVSAVLLCLVAPQAIVGQGGLPVETEEAAEAVVIRLDLYLEGKLCYSELAVPDDFQRLVPEHWREVLLLQRIMGLADREVATAAPELYRLNAVAQHLYALGAGDGRDRLFDQVLNTHRALLDFAPIPYGTLHFLRTHAFPSVAKGMLEAACARRSSMPR